MPGPLMSATDLLNTDVSSLAGTLRAGLGWWLGELGQMVPERWRRPFETRPALTAEPAPDGGYRFSRNGRPAAPPAKAGRPTPVALLLPREAALVREVEAPALSDADIRRMLALDVDRLTPFRAELVYVAVALGRGRDSEGRRPAALAVVPREAANAALAHARASGLDPQAIGIAHAAGIEAGLDFLPQMDEAAAGRSARSRLYVWGAVALLLAANLGVAILRDELDLGRLRAAARAEQPALDQALRLRRQVLDEDARRERIVRAHVRDEPLRPIDAASRAMPNGAWVQRLSWNGHTLRLAGYKQEGVDVLAALRASPGFANVRNSTADIPSRLAAGQPFDITADAVQAQAPGQAQDQAR